MYTKLQFAIYVRLFIFILSNKFKNVNITNFIIQELDKIMAKLMHKLRLDKDITKSKIIALIKPHMITV